MQTNENRKCSKLYGYCLFTTVIVALSLIGAQMLKHLHKYAMGGHGGGDDKSGRMQTFLMMNAVQPLTTYEYK